MKLSILIPSLTTRKHLLDRLVGVLQLQAVRVRNIYEPSIGEVEAVVYLDDGSKTVGAKRNDLLADAKGEYVAFVDDDDLVSDDYVEKLLEGIEKGVDCCSLTGMLYSGGEKVKPFIHSLRYDNWYEDDKNYYRNPNHLNCIKREVAVKAGFPHKDFGEDREFSRRTFPHLFTEHEVAGVIYHYFK